MWRDSEKYSALMLYRLFPAKKKETFKGNVNSIYFDGYIMKGSLVFFLLFCCLNH